jgi:hypothetical protein
LIEAVTKPAPGDRRSADCRPCRSYAVVDGRFNTVLQKAQIHRTLSEAPGRGEARQAQQNDNRQQEMADVMHGPPNLGRCPSGVPQHDEAPAGRDMMPLNPPRVACVSTQRGSNDIAKAMANWIDRVAMCRVDDAPEKDRVDDAADTNRVDNARDFTA